MTVKRKISVVLVDDEPLARLGLRQILEEEQDIVILAESQDGEEGLQQIQACHPDLLFLDIQMPEMNGFDMLRALPGKNMPLVIFVTAFDEYAVHAFRANALDYVLKPFDAERIHATVARARELLRLHSAAAYSKKIIDVLQSIQPAEKYLARIPVRSAGKIILVPVTEILWIEAAADYVILHTAEGKHLLREMIGAMEKQLSPATFVRIHRSAIVNLSSIKELRPTPHGEYHVVLNTGEVVTVSRKYRQYFDTVIASSFR